MEYEVKKIANGNKGLFFNGKFCGIYAEIGKVISQFSGNRDQIFDVEICANFLLKSNTKVYSYTQRVGNQMYLEVRVTPYNREEGTWTEHFKQH